MSRLLLAPLGGDAGCGWLRLAYGYAPLLQEILEGSAGGLAPLSTLNINFGYSAVRRVQNRL